MKNSFLLCKGDYILETKLRKRIDNSVLIEEGWTNQVYETPEGTIIKVFSSHLLEAFKFSLADLSHGKLNIPDREERLQKEVEMKERLRKEGYKAPKVTEVYKRAIEMQRF